MARRIEIELTSGRPDGSWTWRAAGAREPRGVLEGGLLPSGAKAGDVLKAEAEFEIEGITIVSVLAPKATHRPEPNRIEILGSGGPDAPGVTTQLVGRSDRRPGERRRDRDEGRPRREREGGRPTTGRDTTRPRREGPPPEGEQAGARRPDRPPRSDRPDRPAEGAGRGDHSPSHDNPARRGSTSRPDRPERRDRPAGSNRDGADRPARDREAGNRDTGNRDTRNRDNGTGRRGDRPASRGPERGTTAATPEPRAKRFNPGRAHRQAMMASLPPEQQPIAEQLLRGGIPAVRTALHLEREKATAEGRPVPNMDQLIAMAESLLPTFKAAEWRDRAEAAAKDLDDISLRDLRSVVAGADTARDDEARALAASLRDALERRVDTLRRQWSDEVAKYLEENRVVRALRLAARPPEPAARLEVALTERLAEAASQALAPDVPPERWLAVLDAVAASPVRRSVKPAGLPSDPTPEVRRTAHQQSGRVPALAAMLGISIPPPPTPVPPRRPAAPRRAPASSANGPSSQPREAGASEPEESPRVASASEQEPHDGPIEESAERGEDAVVVEELGETFSEG